MANTRLNYRIVWSPHEGSDFFLLGSSNELRLYEYNPKSTPKLAFMSPIVAKYAPMKSFSWSSNPSAPGLIAAGFTNSKIYIYDLYEESKLSESITSSPEQKPYMVLNSKNTKPCNELAFSLDEPNLLATGFERNRGDNGLLIWDVEKAKLSALSGDEDRNNNAPEIPPNKADSVNFNNNHHMGFWGFNDPADPGKFKHLVFNPPIVPKTLPAARVDTHSDAMHSFGMSENVNSISWFPKKPRQLVAGMVGKFLRVFDLRSNQNPVISISNKAVFGIKTDPHNDHRFASFEETNFTGNICLWDDRKTTEAVLSVSTETRPIRISFSPSQSGLLASLSNDASYISLYDIKETMLHEKYRYSPSDESGPDHLSNGFGGDGGMTMMKPSFMGGTSGYVMDYTNGVGESIPSSDGDKFDSDIPVLWKSRKSQKSSKSLISFVWIPTIKSSHSYHLLAMNKEISFETITLNECPNFDWSPLGNLLTFSADSYDVDPNSNNIDKKTDAHDNDVDHNISNSKPIISLGSKVDNDDYSGDRTPRPGNSSKDPSALLNGITAEKKEGEKKPLMPLKTLEELREDISIIMRKRANEGYSMNCQTNEEIVKDSPKLKELWNWISRAENYTLEAKNDVGFQGIHVIWTASTNNKKETPMSTPKASPPPRSFIDRFDPVADANENFVMASTSKLPQRRLALTICGWGLGRRELEETIQKMERMGNYEKAAVWAFFHGKIEKAIATLLNSKDEKLKLVSTALVGYAANMNEENRLWTEMCKRLSHEMGDPYLRAIFSYIASGNWLDVLQEEGLALQDRIGIALRSLDDDDLNYFLDSVTQKVIDDGDIGGIILTGLTQEGVLLFENYVNNTCDVQTASLALSFCVPKRFKDPKVVAWIEEYRMLLDQWKMFDTRAKFDIARGKHMSLASDMVPPQIFVRCNYCTASVSHNLWIQGMKKGIGIPVFPGTNGMISYRQKATCCPGCLKPLPRCSICLLSLGTPTEKEEAAVTSYLQDGNSKDKQFGFDLWFTWCQSCRHGGHATHMLQWFEKHKVCPVSECTCECKITA